VSFKKRAPRAIKEIKEFAFKQMVRKLAALPTGVNISGANVTDRAPEMSVLTHN
jgi:hypothetical protein